MSNSLSITPEYVGMVQQPSVEFYKTSTSLAETFGAFLGELDTCISLEKAKTNDEIVEGISQVYQELNSSNFVKEFEGTTYKFNEQFKLYFIEKYQSLLFAIRDVITLSLGEDNVFFIKFSDDIGNIVNQTSVVDNSTSPFFDTYDNLFTYPNALPASLFNKVSQSQLDSNIQLSIHTDAVLKLNLNGLQDTTDSNIAASSHGLNLVTDNLYIDRLSLLKDPVNAKLKTLLKDMADFINFFKDINYQDRDLNRTAIDLAYDATIEGVETTLDMLKNTIEAGLNEDQADTDDMGTYEDV